LEQWSFDDLHLPTALAKRCVQDIPNFSWRDDSLELWGILGRFVRTCVESVYRTNDEVGDDTELAAWLCELTEEKHGCKFRGIYGLSADGRLTTREDLIRFLHCIIFTTTVGHAAVNNGQYDYMGFVPNMPCTFAMDPRRLTHGGDISDVEIAAALPAPHKESVMQIALSHALTMPTSRPLGTYEADFLFGIPGVTEGLQRLRSELKECSQRIQVRSTHQRAASVTPYTYLDPRFISQSIDI